MSTKNKIEDLRNILFEQLERLNDDEDMSNPERLERELKRANAIREVASVVVESAKVEVLFMRQTDSNGTGFIPVEGLKRLTSS